MVPNERCVIREAFEIGGWRERYAINHGKRNAIFIRGHLCYKFTYSVSDEYQDANGAIYDTVTKTWIN